MLRSREQGTPHATGWLMSQDQQGVAFSTLFFRMRLRLLYVGNSGN
jgi:hypothetical protein